jgi:hypothetical protein
MRNTWLLTFALLLAIPAIAVAAAAVTEVPRPAPIPMQLALPPQGTGLLPFVAGAMASGALALLLRRKL